MKSAPQKPIRRRGPGRSLLRLHRRIGVALSAVFIFICLTGIALNHSADLKLNQRLVDADWLYHWYGFQPEGELRSFATPSGALSQLGRTLYLDTEEIGQCEPLIGAIGFQGMLIAATPSELLLFTEKGELIERLSSPALPSTQITRIQSVDTQLVIKTDTRTYATDSDFIEWNATTWKADGIEPQQTTPIQATREAILSEYRGDGLSWHRLLLDLHSGRFFGAMGKWVADLTALALIFLTISGLLYTARYLRKARERASKWEGPHR